MKVNSQAGNFLSLHLMLIGTRDYHARLSTAVISALQGRTRKARTVRSKISSRSRRLRGRRRVYRIYSRVASFVRHRSYYRRLSLESRVKVKLGYIIVRSKA